jgi:hypothetical protein
VTDHHLRELDRRFRASGSVEDAAAWLRARVQAGELTEHRLALAAYLGSPAADMVVQPELIGAFHAVLDEQGGPVRETLNIFEHAPTGPLANWSAVLPTERAELCIRVALAACRVAALQHPEMAWTEEVFTAIEDYLLGPQTPHALETLGNYWWSHTRNSHPEDPDGPRARAFGWAVTNAQILASYDPEGAGGPPEGQEAFDEWRAEWADNRPMLGDVLAGAQHALGSDGENLVAQAIEAEVTPWLLGLHDPVRERLEARQREVAGE